MADKRIHGYYEISEHAIQEAKSLIERLNRRAERIGISPLELEISEPIDRPHPKNEGVMVRWFPITLTGDRPKIAGWEFVAKVDHEMHDKELGDMVLQLPSNDRNIPDEYRHRGPHCDHCRADRFRVVTYLLWSEDEERWTQVGSSCIADFLGHKDPYRYFDWLQSVVDAMESAALGWYEEIERGGPQTSDRLNTLRFLSYAVASVDRYGWFSKGTARDHGGISTAEVAFLSMAQIGDKEYRVKPTKTDKNRAAEILRWVRDELGGGDRIAELNDYEYNLLIACSKDSFKMRYTGIVASAIAAHNRAHGLTVNGNERKEISSEWVGEVKDRKTWNLTVEIVRKFDTQYGTSVLYLMSDSDGHIFKWFSTSWPVKVEHLDAFLGKLAKGEGFRADMRLEEGWTYRITGTIKKHDEYNGIKQTELTRAKVEQILARPELETQAD